MAKPKSKKTNGGPRGFTTYTTYNWVDHDPVLDWIDTLKKDDGSDNALISAKTRVSKGTLHNWETRKTKSPKLSTIAAVARHLGADVIPITAEGRRTIRAR